MEPLGPNGEFIIDYSIFDAIRNGFNKIVFIIKEEHYDIFKDTIGKRIENKLNEKNIKIEYVFQDTKNIENRANLPEDRVKPYGTAHAVLCAKNVIHEPFVIINADDFYGNDAYKAISEYIDNNDKNELGVVGYNVINTLTENGSVKRGVCETKNGKLEKIIEQVRSNHEPLYHADDLMHIYLNSGDYQSVCNQTVIREIVYMFYRDVLPETQLDYIDDYLQSITEAQLIEDVTELIDNYKKEMM